MNVLAAINDYRDIERRGSTTGGDAESLEGGAASNDGAQLFPAF